MSAAKHLDRANLPARRQPKAFVILSAAKNLDLRQPGSFGLRPQQLTTK
jgi:hypothetical protein